MAPKRSKSHIVVMFFFVLLSACSSIEERQARVRGVLDEGASTASGVFVMIQDRWMVVWQKITTVFRVGEKAVQHIEKTIYEVDRRIEQVGQGIDKIQDGKALIEEGLLRGRGD